MTEEKKDYVLDRREICDRCEHKKVIIGAKFCDVCGCAIWGKTLIRAEKCPKGKWDEAKD